LSNSLKDNEKQLKKLRKSDDMDYTQINNLNTMIAQQQKAIESLQKVIATNEKTIESCKTKL